MQELAQGLLPYWWCLGPFKGHWNEFWVPCCPLFIKVYIMHALKMHWNHSKITPKHHKTTSNARNRYTFLAFLYNTIWLLLWFCWYDIHSFLLCVSSKTAIMLTFDTLKSNQICPLLIVGIFGAVCSWPTLLRRLLSLSHTRCSGRVVW